MKMQCFIKKKKKNLSQRNQASPSAETAIVVVKWNKMTIPSPTAITSQRDETIWGSVSCPSAPALSSVLCLPTVKHLRLC